MGAIPGKVKVHESQFHGTPSASTRDHTWNMIESSSSTVSQACVQQNPVILVGLARMPFTPHVSF